MILPGIRMNFSRQGTFRIDRFFGQEPWAGQTFSLDRWRVMGGGQVLRWLNVDGQYSFGNATYYDPEAPFAGNLSQARLTVTVQPTPRFSESVSYSYSRFTRPTGERVYDVSIVNSKTVYQFSKQFFIRGIVRYDSQQRRVLTDALASYELRPGTVVYGGYGALLDQRSWDGEAWLPGTGSYVTTQRSFFFKASYLWRF